MHNYHSLITPKRLSKLEVYQQFPFRLMLCLLFGVLFMTSGCQKEPDNLTDEIKRSERGINRASSEKKEELIALYEQYASTYPDRHEENAAYLHKAANLSLAINRVPKAIALLQNAIKEHYPGAQTSENVFLLGNIYAEKVRNEHLSAITYQSGDKAFPQNTDFKEKINSGWPSSEDRLKSIKKTLFDSVGINYPAVNNYINGCVLYCMILPKDEKSSDLLFEAAQVANQTRSFPKALELFDWLTLKYPDYPKTSQAMFISAFVLDRDLKRYDEAKVKYERFLEKYPNDQFAKDARFLLENLGVPPEEIVKRFEEANN